VKPSMNQYLDISSKAIISHQLGSLANSVTYYEKYEIKKSDNPTPITIKKLI
jgi:hypothetical protein